MTHKDTLCWECKNFSKCDWSKGKPIKDWVAIPTKFKDVLEGEETLIQHSYCVIDCPQFIPDDLRMVTLQELSDLLHISSRTLFRWFNSVTGTKRLITLLKTHGYRLHVFDDIVYNSYYLETIVKEN